MKVCTRCKRLKPDNGSRLCFECTQMEKANRVRKRDYAKEYAKRVSEDDEVCRKFYRSKQWRMTSLQFMVDRGHKCEECGSIGTDVHHVVPIQTKEGWERRLDVENLQLLCVRCHNKKHGRNFATSKSSD